MKINLRLRFFLIQSLIFILFGVLENIFASNSNDASFLVRKDGIDEILFCAGLEKESAVLDLITINRNPIIVFNNGTKLFFLNKSQDSTFFNFENHNLTWGPHPKTMSQDSNFIYFIRYIRSKFAAGSGLIDFECNANYCASFGRNRLGLELFGAKTTSPIPLKKYDSDYGTYRMDFFFSEYLIVSSNCYDPKLVRYRAEFDLFDLKSRTLIRSFEAAWPNHVIDIKVKGSSIYAVIEIEKNISQGKNGVENLRRQCYKIEFWNGFTNFSCSKVKDFDERIFEIL